MKSNESVAGKVTHTPGPWKVGELRSVTGNAFDGSAKNIVDQVRGGSREAADANARLIASAPDLLQALRDLVELVDARAPEAAHWPDVDAARAAIAKAEGQ